MRALSVLLAALAAWLAVDSRARRRLGDPPTATPTAVLARARQHGQRVIGVAGFGPSARRARARDRTAVIQALAALAAELESGQSAIDALDHAGGRPSIWPAASAASRLGGDVAAALRIDARSRPPLLQLSACWAVGARTGAGLAASVARLAASARAAEDVRVQLEAQLAAPRATARMLGLLPVIGLGFGVALGSDPLGWLLGSPIGITCLTLGLALTSLGMWWTGRIARRVEAML